MRKDIILSVLLLAVFIWAIESQIKSPPSVKDVISSIGNQDSFCWRVELSDNLTEEEIFACVNYKNQSAFWRVTSGNGNSLIRAFPGDEFYDLNWDLVLHSKGVEWNALNFAGWVLTKGTVEGIEKVGLDEYKIHAIITETYSYSVGSIENGSQVEERYRVEAVFRVDGRGNLEGGRFTWRSERIYIDWNRREVAETDGSFEMLGPWKR